MLIFNYIIQMIKLHLLRILLLTVNLNLLSASKQCGADDLNIKPEFINISISKNENNTNGVFLEQEIWQSIRIHLDFTNIEADTSLDRIWISNFKSFMYETFNVFQNTIKVKRLTERLHVPYCYMGSEAIILNDDIMNGVIADLVVIFKIDYNLANKNILAWAGACLFNSINNRPIAGLMGIHPDKFNFNKINSRKKLFSLIFHEITHIFVFHHNFYSMFWDNVNNKPIPKDKVLKENYIINGVPRNLIITPKVVEAARKHFNCPLLIGVEVENQGGSGSAGSHWERRIMNGDYMIAQTSEDSSISEITFALFEDSGWYKMDSYSSGGLFQFGRNAGCSFLNSPCIVNEKATSKYFCDTNRKPQCFSGHRNKGICYLTLSTTYDPNYKYFSSNQNGDMFADYCPIPISYSQENFEFPSSCKFGKTSTLLPDYNEVIGDNSGCFISNLSSLSLRQEAVCFEYLCDKNNLTVQIKYENQILKCPREGGEIKNNNYSGSILCPDYYTLCSATVKCNDMLDCLLKKSIKIDESTNTLIDTNTNSNTNTINTDSNTNTNNTNNETNSRKDLNNTSSNIIPESKKSSSIHLINISISIAVTIIFLYHN